MIPWKHIDTTRVPGSDVELRLMQRGVEFSMKLGQNELMSSRLSGSEEALATLACRRLEAVKAPHLLIGGLGMGFTLRAALAVLGAESADHRRRTGARRDRLGARADGRNLRRQPRRSHARRS